MSDNENLAERVEPLSKDLAWLIRDRNSEVQALSTPFFRQGRIWRVLHRGEHHPLVFTVGCAGADLTVLLARQPEAFQQLVAKAGLDLSTADKRLQYVITFLETTRDFGRRFQILRAARDIELIPRATPPEKDRHQQLLAKYGPVITGPVLGGEGPWTATVFALRGQDLVQLSAKLSADGTLAVAESVLEKDVPVARTT
jgi:hypothetical protein